MVRVKYRFLICQLLPAYYLDKDKNISGVKLKDLQQSIKDKIQELYGDIGVGEVGQATTVKYLESQFCHIFIVKTLRELENQVLFTLSCINKIKDVDVVIRTVTTRSCERTAVEDVKNIFQKAFAHVEIGEGDRTRMLDDVLKIVDIISL